MALDRERTRREVLHRQIGAMRTKLQTMDPDGGRLARYKFFRLVSKIRRLEADVSQLRLV